MSDLESPRTRREEVDQANWADGLQDVDRTEVRNQQFENVKARDEGDAKARTLNYARFRRQLDPVWRSVHVSSQLITAESLLTGSSSERDIRLRYIARSYARESVRRDRREGVVLGLVGAPLSGALMVALSIWTSTWWFGIAAFFISLLAVTAFAEAKTLKKVAMLVAALAASSLYAANNWQVIQEIALRALVYPTGPSSISLITASLITAGFFVSLTVIGRVTFWLSEKRLKSMRNRELFDVIVSAKLALAACAIHQSRKDLDYSQASHAVREMEELSVLLRGVRSRMSDLTRPELTLVDDRFRRAGHAIERMKMLVVLGSESERLECCGTLADAAVGVAMGYYSYLPDSQESGPVTLSVRLRTAIRSLGVLVLGCLPLAAVVTLLNTPNPLSITVLNAALLPAVALALATVLGGVAPLLLERIKAGGELIAYLRGKG